MEWVVYLLLALPLLVSAGLAVLLVLLLLACHASVLAGMWLVAATSLLQTVTGNAPVLHLGLALFPGDLMSLVLAPVAALRLLQQPHRCRGAWGWWVFSAAVFVSLGTGLLSFGTTAGVQARDYVHFVLVGSYLLSFEYDEQLVPRLCKVLGGLVLALVLLTVYRWIVYYTPIPSLLPPGGVYNIDGAMRVVWSNDALLMGLVLIGLAFFIELTAPARRPWASVMVLLAMVLLLQHRSVWMAVLVGAMGPLIAGGQSNAAMKRLALFAGVFLLILAPVFLSDRSAGLASELQSRTSSALSAQGSASDRLQGWTAMVTTWSQGGPQVLALGNSFGTPNTRFIVSSEGELRKVDYFAHNMYVQTLFNTGLAGISGFLALLWTLLAGLRKGAADPRLAAECRMLFVFVLMIAVYLIPYGVHHVQGLVIGAGILCARAAQRQALPGRMGARHAG